MLLLARRLGPLLGALALVLVACTSGAGDGSTSSPRADDGISNSPSLTQGPAGNGDGGGRSAEVPAILDFEAPLVGGGTLHGAALAGAPVAVWFWAPW